MRKTTSLLLTIALSALPVFGAPSQADMDKARKLKAAFTNEFFTFVDQKIKAGKDLSYWLEMRALSSLGRGFISVEDSHLFAARDAARLEPSNPHVLTTYAILLAYKRKAEVAQQLINRVLKVVPKDARAHAAQALIAFVKGEQEFAHAEIQLAIKLAPGDPDVNEIAYEIYRKALDQDQAEAALDRWVKIKPTDIFALRNRGEFARINDNYPLSMKDCKAAIAINPHYDDAWVVMIHTLVDMKDYKAVIVEANKFLEKSKMSPPFALTWERRGDAYLIMKDYKKALADYTATIKILSPNQDDTKYNTAIVHMDPEKQKSYMRSWINRCNMYSKVGDFQRAIKNLDILLAAKPDNAMAVEMRMQVNMAAKQNEAALKDLNRLIAIDPDVAEWYRLKAGLLRKMGKEAEAVKVDKRLHEVVQYGTK